MIAAPETVVRPFIHALVDRLGRAAVRSLETYRRARDGAGHHVTLLSPPECDSLGIEHALPAPSRVYKIRLIGVGCVRHAASVSYYVVAESPAVQALRHQLGLPIRHLHVTLGFMPEDIHEVAKDQSTIFARIPPQPPA